MQCPEKLSDTTQAVLHWVKTDLMRRRPGWTVLHQQVLKGYGIAANLHARFLAHLDRACKVYTKHMEYKVLFLASLDQFRYEHDLHLHVCVDGQNSGGKSRAFKVVESTMIPDSARAPSKMTANALNTEDSQQKNNWYVLLLLPLLLCTYFCFHTGTCFSTTRHDRKTLGLDATIRRRRPTPP